MPGWTLNNNIPQAPIVQQPTVVVNTNVQGPMVVQPRDWSSGLCGCMNDCSGCIAVMFCPFCYQFHLSSRAGESCFLPFIPGTLIAVRTKIRLLNMIRGSICDDCIKLSFCLPCTLCQMARELDKTQI